MSLTIRGGAQSPPGAGQPPPATTPPQRPAGEQRPPIFRSESNFVRVDVYPTRDGQPVFDLQAGDFAIEEDGVAQKVESFEHIVVRPAGPQNERIEPSSQREMLQAAENPRNRVFVIFLDQAHVPFEASAAITEPLIRLINRMLGPDDLVGIMTPDMSASDIVLARRTEVTEERLRTHWRWGDRFAQMNDEREDAYLACYNPLAFGGVAGEMIARKRERETLEALQDVVRYLNGVREERKAVIAVTHGWDLFTPLRQLEERTGGATGRVPSVDPVGIGPNGTLTTKDPRNRATNNTATNMECDADRMRLANLDDQQFLRDIINDANRTNTTFYPIDPRGLVALETGGASALALDADQKLRRTHLESIRTLADGTDGIAVVNTNDLDQGLKRISDDLTSYYLLGYYSSNTKLDGGYRALKVKVTRPGVNVRARRGYRAASAAEVARARTAAAAPAVDVGTPVQAALAMLGSIRPEARVRLRATMSPGTSTVWVTGEVSADAGRADEWGQGGTADLQVTVGGATTGARVTLKPGDRTFLTSVMLSAAPTATIDLQARLTPAAGGAASTDTLHLQTAAQPVFYRRGPASANRQVPTADVRFTRADRVRLELPVGPDVKPGTGRMLDRTGQPLAVPVTIGERVEGTQHWITADLALAPLAPGDYAVEIRTIAPTGESGVITALRVVR
ncbi:MAG: VWA domain-containing protein [Vicinamibacterales bacterium]